MNNFTFQLPTKIIFGSDTQHQVGEQIKPYANRVLLHYGGGSVKKSGLYGQITASLDAAGVSFVELGGVQPNPRLRLVQEGIALCRKENIGFILAVGGGSVIDSAKAISMGVPYRGDVWDFYCGKAEARECLPVATVLTIPAAGSESSPSSVITKEETQQKFGCGNEITRPVFSILNPAFCATLPDNQVANGAADIMAHIMERYFTNTKHVDFTDRLCEATLKTILYNIRAVKCDKNNLDAWAEVMWAGSVAHNDLLGLGREEDWASHGLEHELSALYDIAHGAGLAIIFPAWMKYVYKQDVSRFVQFAVRVFDIEIALGEPDCIALEGIARLEAFFKEIGLPTRLCDIGIDDSRLAEMAQKIADEGGKGAFVKIGYEQALAIYRLAL